MSSRFFVFVSLIIGIGYSPLLRHSFIVCAEEIIEKTILDNSETTNQSSGGIWGEIEETENNLKLEEQKSEQPDTDVNLTSTDSLVQDLENTDAQETISRETSTTDNDLKIEENLDINENETQLKEKQKKIPSQETTQSINTDKLPTDNSASSSIQRPKQTFAHSEPTIDSFPAATSEVFLSPEVSEENKEDSSIEISMKKSNPFANAIGRYNTVLEKHYRVASFVQASVLGILGDILAQFFEGRQLRKIDYKGQWFNGRRTFDISILCMLIDGYVTPLYYDALELISTKRTLPVVLLKTFIGSAIWGPLSNGVFLAGVPLMRYGVNVPSYFNFPVWKEQLKMATIRDFQTWPVLDAINFRFLPKHWRPFFANLAGVGIIAVMGLFSLFPWPGA